MTSALDIWLTSCGRACAVTCARELVRWGKNLDYRLLIFESQPENPHGTVDAFKALDCEKVIWTGDYPPLGWIYNLLTAETRGYFLRVDDDCWFVCDPAEQIAEAMDLIETQPVKGEVISNVPLEMNPRLAFDSATGKAPEGANKIPLFSGWADGGKFGPLGMVGHPGSLHVGHKKFLMPWNETVHWRQTELYYILDQQRRRLWSAYMLKWWGCMGHFSPAGVDGVSREKNLALYNAYRDKGYWGRRPTETWPEAFLGTDIPDRMVRP